MHFKMLTKLLLKSDYALKMTLKIGNAGYSVSLIVNILFRYCLKLSLSSKRCSLC